MVVLTFFCRQNNEVNSAASAGGNTLGYVVSYVVSALEGRFFFVVCSTLFPNPVTIYTLCATVAREQYRVILLSERLNNGRATAVAIEISFN